MLMYERIFHGQLATFDSESRATTALKKLILIVNRTA